MFIGMKYTRYGEIQSQEELLSFESWGVSLLNPLQWVVCVKYEPCVCSHIRFITYLNIL